MKLERSKQFGKQGWPIIEKEADQARPTQKSLHYMTYMSITTLHIIEKLPKLYKENILTGCKQDS